MLGLVDYSGKICAKMPEYGPNMPEYCDLKCPNGIINKMPEYLHTKCPNKATEKARMLGFGQKDCSIRAKRWSPTSKLPEYSVQLNLIDKRACGPAD